MTDVTQQQQLISCRVCGSLNGLRRCSKCKIAFYCSQVHQQSDWKIHKVECRKFCRNSNNFTSNNNSLHFQTHQENSTSLWCEKSKNKINLLSNEGTSEVEILSVHAEAVSTVPHIGQSSKFVNREEERDKHRHFHSLSENTMRISEENLLNPNLLPSEMRYDDLCKHIINDMNMYGLSVVDDFLGMHKGLEILNEVHHMYAAGVFKNGQLVSNNVAERDLRTIRGDKITWVKGTESGCINIGFLINQVDNVVISANKMRDNGSLGNYKIRERTKAMVACYPGSGAHYVMHVDNPNRDGRVITAIYYLNLNWDTKRSGGILRIFPEHGGTVADIEPKFDRIIFFWSDRRNPHEVQPSHRTRYAITVWYFDADERESALNRYRQYQQTVT